MQRVKAYDGLKTIAILSIILYHLWPTIFSGGFLFVNSFLVLSGYLAANKLNDLTIRQDFKEIFSYLFNQIKRLWLPMFVMIMLVVVFLLIFNRSILSSIQLDIFASLLFSSNIAQLASDKSYFTEMAFQSPFTHLWYVAIHVQSLIISAFLSIILNQFSFKHSHKALFWLSLMTISHLAMLLLYQPGTDPTFVYYSFLTRYSSFAGGIACYYLVPYFDEFLDHFDDNLIHFSEFIILFISFFALISISFIVSDSDHLTYQIWLTYFNLLTISYIFITHRKIFYLEKMLDHRIIHYFGQSTYSHYLWYYPLIVVGTNFIRHFQNRPNLLFFLILLTILVISGIFYFIVESKVRSFSIKDSVNNLLSFRESPLSATSSLAWLGLFLCFVIALFFTGNNKPVALLELEYNEYKGQTNIGRLPFPGTEKMIQTHDTLSEMDQELNTQFIENNAFKTPLTSALEKNPRIDTSVIAEINEENQAILAEIEAYNPEIMEILTPEELLFAAEVPVTFFGDSLTLLGEYTFSTVFLNSNTLGVKSLQIWDSYPYVQELIDAGRLQKNVVINLGTNAGLDEEGMEQLIDQMGDRTIYLVNTNSAVEHLGQVNDVIDTMVNKYPHVHLVDWYSFAQGETDLYAHDDIHLSPMGMNYYSALVAQTMMQQNGQ
ncbi:acyltransferase [Aerococcaceae bacterium DSM 111020]|nr:acyltransferase [Aerococcaceae bacterium DSM 111020]